MFLNAAITSIVAKSVAHAHVRHMRARPVPRLHVFTNTIALTSSNRSIAPSARQHVHVHRALQKQSTHTNTWLSSESPPRTNQLKKHRNQTPDFTPAVAPREVQGGADAELWLSLSPLACEPNGQFQTVRPELSIPLLLVSVTIDMDTTIASTLPSLCT